MYVKKDNRCLLLIGYEAPQVHLQIVSVHLDLLQSEATECAQTNAFHQGLYC